MEIIKLKEIETKEELEKLRQTTLRWLCSDLYKKEDSLPHDDPYLPSFISPDSYHGAIIVVALGKTTDEYPELKFSEDILSGYYATEFFSVDKENYAVPWTKHDKKVMQVYIDRIYIPHPFRNIGIATKLVNYMEDVLRKHEFGNIEFKPDEHLKEWVIKKGFETIDNFRYGKLL